jgi:zinc and cadmium transporter
VPLLDWLLGLPTPALLLVLGLAMSAIALTGALAVGLPDATLDRLIGPAVALAAGSLLGGALFHLIPGAVTTMGNGTAVWVWIAAGFVLFQLLEQLLHWHHHHAPRREHAHEPVTWLLLLADGLHNFLGGLAVGGAVVLDPRVGLTTWLAAAAHEVPQEVGDFAVLMNGGWSRARALLANFLSALTFPLGALLAWLLSEHLDVAWLVALGAGNFLYIAAADLVPTFKATPSRRAGTLHLACFLAGLGLLLAVRLVAHG